MILEIKIQSDEKETVHWALNDFVIDHGPSARVIKLKVYVSDELVNEIDILAAEDVKRSNIFVRLFTSLNYLVWGDV